MEDVLTLPSAELQEHRYERRYIDEGEGQTTASPGSRWRSPAQRDYDRLLYSSAFQRLGGITQVTASEIGRPFHTRLTHTLKVAQVARRSAERLKGQLANDQLAGAAATLVADCLDIDATEAAALAHDLGHPPFGHLAEDVLRRKAERAGGFEGNAQSFRIAVRLASRSASPGLDLTRHTLNGMLKYPWARSEEAQGENSKRQRKWGRYDSDRNEFDWVRKYSRDDERSLEACLMDWADDVTYAVHDLDDFSRAGLIPIERLAVDKTEQKRYERRLEQAGLLEDDGPGLTHLLAALRHVDLEGEYEGRTTQRVALRSFGSMLITRYIEALTLSPVDDHTVRVEIDENSRLQVEALKLLTRVYVIDRPSLAVIQRGQSRLVEYLWDTYRSATESKGDRRLLPEPYRTEVENVGDNDALRDRLVTDLVAGLTEASAVELYSRVTGFSKGSILDAVAYAH